MAFDRYPGDRALTFPVASCLELAKRFLRCGYRVTVATDPGGSEGVKNALSQAKGPFKVQGVENADQLTELVDRWLRYSLQGLEPGRPTRLGVLVFSGHGVQRAGEPFFLTPADTKQQGGLSLDRVRKASADKKLPLVLVVDACRTEAARGAGVTKSDPKNAPSELWAASPGWAVQDRKNNLVKLLADGLAIHDDGEFEANKRRIPFTDQYLLPPRLFALTVQEWFRYAVNVYNSMHDGDRGPERSWGIVERLTELAVGGKDKPAALLPVLRTEDLLDKWDNFAGELVAERAGPEVRLSWPDEVREPSKFFAAGLLDEAVETEGKTLLVEVVAQGTDIRFGIHPENSAGDNGTPVVYNPGKYDMAHLARRGVTTLSHVPLVKGPPDIRMDRIGFSPLARFVRQNWPPKSPPPGDWRLILVHFGSQFRSTERRGETGHFFGFVAFSSFAFIDSRNR